MSSEEKRYTNTEARTAPLGDRSDIHEYKENEGYEIDVEDAAAGGDRTVKLAKDGHTKLISQPSDDAQDPLNWSWGKKHIILFIVAFSALLPDYGSATG